MAHVRIFRSFRGFLRCFLDLRVAFMPIFHQFWFSDRGVGQLKGFLRETSMHETALMVETVHSHYRGDFGVWSGDCLSGLTIDQMFCEVQCLVSVSNELNTSLTDFNRWIHSMTTSSQTPNTRHQFHPKTDHKTPAQPLIKYFSIIFLY